MNMKVKESNISESARFKEKYQEILQNVKERFRVKDAKYIQISESKASRILSGNQFDMLTLCEIASFVGYDIDIKITDRNNNNFH